MIDAKGDLSLGGTNMLPRLGHLGRRELQELERMAVGVSKLERACATRAARQYLRTAVRDRGDIAQPRMRRRHVAHDERKMLKLKRVRIDGLRIEPSRRLELIDPNALPPHAQDLPAARAGEAEERHLGSLERPFAPFGRKAEHLAVEPDEPGEIGRDEGEACNLSQPWRSYRTALT
jgi:hypothetical protein